MRKILDFNYNNIIDSNNNNNNNDNNRIKAFLKYIESENIEKVYKINENISISDNIIFNLFSIIQIIIFLCITWIQILRNIQNLNGTGIKDALDTKEFLILSSVMMTSCGIIFLNSAIDFLERCITFNSIFEIFIKFILLGAIVSPFIGAFISNSGESESPYPYIFYLYFFIVQQNILAMLLAIQVGSIYNNKLINYISLSFLQLMFHIGTATFIEYTKITLNDDDTTNILVACSYTFSYIPIILYSIMVILKILCYIYFKKIDIEDVRFLLVSFTALFYQIGLSVLYENIGLNVVDQEVKHSLGFILIIIILSFIFNLVPQKILRRKLQLYSASLEKVLVEARIVEKEKLMAWNLLTKILPESVVAELQVGNKVTPEYFEEVTIFISDIEGFTNICSIIDPDGVVNFLNKIYTIMDFAQSLFPTYKVETIGDAYLVVSGLPIRDTNHAVHIANFALLVRDLVNLVKSPISDTSVKIRIGLHTGPGMK